MHCASPLQMQSVTNVRCGTADQDVHFKVLRPLFCFRRFSRYIRLPSHSIIVLNYTCSCWITQHICFIIEAICECWENFRPASCFKVVSVCIFTSTYDPQITKHTFCHSISNLRTCLAIILNHQDLAEPTFMKIIEHSIHIKILNYKISNIDFRPLLHRRWLCAPFPHTDIVLEKKVTKMNWVPIQFSESPISSSWKIIACSNLSL